MKKLSLFLTHLVAAVAAILVAFPFFWMLSTSLKPLDETTRFPPTLLPQEWRWHNYVEALQAAPFGRYFLNSAMVSLTVTAGVLFTALLAGYAFGAMEFRGRRPLFYFYLTTMMIPFEVR
jgi:multiple sugar transport system permease protein